MDAMMDVRRYNTSQLAGWAKWDELSYILELVGLSYQHLLSLAPDALLLDHYRRGELSWDEYAASYQQQLEGVERTATFALLASYRHPALLCAEDNAAYCHRRLAAAWLATQFDLPVLHLTSLGAGKKLGVQAAPLRPTYVRLPP